MKFVIDRFEGEFAVVEIEVNNEKKMINIPKSILPSMASEGDVIETRIDDIETQRRKDRIKYLMKDVWE